MRTASSHPIYPWLWLVGWIVEDVSIGPPSSSLSNPSAQCSSVNWQNVLKNRWGRGGGGGWVCVCVWGGGWVLGVGGGVPSGNFNCASGTPADVNKHGNHHLPAWNKWRTGKTDRACKCVNLIGYGFRVLLSESTWHVPNLGAFIINLIYLLRLCSTLDDGHVTTTYTMSCYANRQTVTSLSNFWSCHVVVTWPSLEVEHSLNK